MKDTSQSKKAYRSAAKRRATSTIANANANAGSDCRHSNLALFKACERAKILECLGVMVEKQ